MPLPAKMDLGTGALAIDGKFTVAVGGVADAKLDAGVTRFIAELSRQTGIQIASRKPVAGPATLKVECAAAGPLTPALNENESYTLDVTPEGARLKAATVDGALRGLATVMQLVAPGASGFTAPAVHIEDSPRFRWRGLLLDVSRHWMPVEVVERNLDAMAAVKMNVLHWHLVDDQGFRVESKRYPLLQAKGSDGLFYTQAQIREVVAYARARGIRVVPEFDVPGHTTSWMPGYPMLDSAKGPYEILRTFGISYAVMDPTKESTYLFLDNFFGEMAALFPDAYFHIGGDEVNPRSWNQNPKIQAFEKLHHMSADPRAGAHDLQVYFNKRILKILQKHGKIMIGWDEILHPDLPKATVVQVWRGQKDLAASAQKGYRAILSWGYYLDHLSTAAFHYANDPMGGPAAQLTPEEAERILGGEACMWAELVSSETVDSRVWPRLAAVAERLWSPQSVNDPDSMYDRLQAVSRQLEWTGAQHRASFSAMLDRLAAGRPVEPLRVLGEASEALGLGRRSAAKINTATPLNRFVDAIRPESESIRQLELAAKRVAAGPPASADIALLTDAFARWAANDARFQEVADGNSLLTELAVLSRDLSAAGVAGQKLLDGFNGGTPPPAEWLTSEATELTRVLRPNADVTLAAARVVKTLLDAQQKRAGAVGPAPR
jgi:hexosaminidase